MKAITFKEVKKDRSDFEAGEAWRKIGEITGAGHVPPSEDATIDLTDVAQGKIERIERLLHPETDVVIDEKKRGNK